MAPVTTHNVDRLKAFLFADDTFSEVVLAQLLFMYLTTCVSGLLFQRFSPRVRALPARSQQQLYTSIPVIVVKMVLTILLIPGLLSDGDGGASIPLSSSSSWSSSSPADTLVARYRLLLLFAFSYPFELLQRPASARVVAHHLVVQALPFYFRLHLVEARRRPAALVALELGFFERLAALGPGLSSVVADLLFLLYRACPRTPVGRAAVDAVCGLARAVQCAALLHYVYARAGSPTMALLGACEKSAFAVTAVAWAWLQGKEVQRMRGLARKFRETALQRGA